MTIDEFLGMGCAHRYDNTMPTGHGYLAQCLSTAASSAEIAALGATALKDAMLAAAQECRTKVPPSVRLSQTAKVCEGCAELSRIMHMLADRVARADLVCQMLWEGNDNANDD